MGREHTSKVYEQELRTLGDKILLMGTLVEEMIVKGIDSLTKRDSELARETMRMDRRINRLECEVDELALRILATRQPVASDLRFITMALKIVTDLERIGDLGVNICERVIELSEEPPLEVDCPIGKLADEAKVALHESLNALSGRDVALATQILTEDDLIDQHYQEVFEAILRLMSREPAAIYRATRIQSIAKYLERIGDHAMNIAETVVFLVNGKDIRHWNRLHDDGSFPRPRGGSRPPPSRAEG
jgi:phosphate transport system protein